MHPQCERSEAALEFDCDDPWGLLLMWIRLQGSQLLTLPISQVSFLWVIAQHTLTSKSSYEVSLLSLLYLHDFNLMIFTLAGSCAGLLMRDPHHHLLGFQLPGCPTKMR